uniref:SagB family peptide dehydrogenase n=1 Tax=Streptomyces specialis TaxID=498367 RepID=UPI00073F33C9
AVTGHDTGPLLARLRDGGWLDITVTDGDRALYTIRPLRSPPPVPPADARELTLSRFAVLRADGHGMVLESPHAWCEIRIHDPAVAAALAGLAGAGPRVAAPALPAPVLGRLPRDLRRAALAVPRGGDADAPEARSRQWSPHELWFHDRSRLGDRGRDGFGATFRARGPSDPPPVRPDPYPGPAIALHRPDLDALRRADPPLTAVLEDRRSVRAHDEDRPLTARQLGAFLHRCARTRRGWAVDGVQQASRPYPSGGALYELEVYPVVSQVAGLDPGMYHYDSHGHRLRLVAGDGDPAVRRLLRVAGRTSAAGPPAQVLLVLSARMDRVLWKYEAMGYALVLKHVGALYQTMYLVATAMGLAGCAVGAGDAAAFARATGRDPVVECGVGEFILGSLPAGAEPPARTGG